MRYYLEMKDEMKVTREYKFGIPDEYRSLVRSCNARRIRISLGDKNYQEALLRPCAYCGRTKNNVVKRIDHLNAEGYSLNNIESVCASCFVLKGELSRKAFLGAIRHIVKHTTEELPGVATKKRKVISQRKAKIAVPVAPAKKEFKDIEDLPSSASPEEEDDLEDIEDLENDDEEVEEESTFENEEEPEFDVCEDFNKYDIDDLKKFRNKPGTYIAYDGTVKNTRVGNDQRSYLKFEYKLNEHLKKYGN